MSAVPWHGTQILIFHEKLRETCLGPQMPRYSATSGPSYPQSSNSCPPLDTSWRFLLPITCWMMWWVGTSLYLYLEESSDSFIKYWSASRTSYLSSLLFQGLCGKPRPTLWLPTLWSSKTTSLSNRLIWAQEVNCSTSGLVLFSQRFIKLQSTVQLPFWTILHPSHRYCLWDSDFLLKYPEWRD